MYYATTATKKVRDLTKRIRIVQGGTSASKTVSILLDLIDKAQSDKVPTLTSVVSESFPHLRRGAIRDFLLIMKEHNYFQEARWLGGSQYTFETGSVIEFFGADQPDKLRGARRERLFINECNNVSFEVFEQLEVRTKQLVYLDYNPTNEFWVFTELIGKRDDIDYLILTYKDNEALSKEIIDSIEQRRNRTGWWKVYGLGQLGEVDGKIYKDWKIIDEIPHEARLERRGLDFGYTNDPTAVVDIYYYNGSYILDETVYRKGMGNKLIADTINNLKRPETLIIADSAEPKSIDELKLYKLNVLPTVKGPGSLATGIAFVQSQQISVTSRSSNLINEYRNYLWRTDPKTGKIINVPEAGNDHALDAARYALSTVTRPQEYISTAKVVYHSY